MPPFVDGRPRVEPSEQGRFIYLEREHLVEVVEDLRFVIGTVAEVERGPRAQVHKLVEALRVPDPVVRGEPRKVRVTGERRSRRRRNRRRTGRVPDRCLRRTRHGRRLLRPPRSRMSRLPSSGRSGSPSSVIFQNRPAVGCDSGGKGPLLRESASIAATSGTTRLAP